MQSFAHFSLFCALKGLIMEKNIAIFASGSGTNAENIIRYFEGNDSVRVKLVLSNRKDAYVLERAHRLGVPCRAFPKSDWEIAESILDLLREHQIDLIVLAGFLLRIPDALLHAYYIDEHYDEGSIIFQAKCSVLPGDTPAEVAKKVHALEYEWFPRIIEQTVNTFL